MDLIEAVRKKEIDLVNLKQASPLLLKQIVSKSLLLYEKHQGSFNEFILYVYRIYRETVNLRRLEKEYVLGRTKDYALELKQ